MAAPMVGEERLETVKVREKFGSALIKVKEWRGETYLCVDRERLPEVVQFLKDDPDLQYNYFVECVGVDYSDWSHDRDLGGRFEVVYNLYSLKHNSRLFLKVSADDGQPVPSLVGIFLGAEYPEREVQDLYGVVFEGNGPRKGERFLLPDDWVGFPLRKEYPLGGEDVVFAHGTRGPAVEDIAMPHAGESWEGKTGTEEISGR
ncbi:MAG: NADH-quinone oxidoreductase subunit C [Armatimonadetes bacterium]|nr:NADH-quinone oxidoreductase subunit C [Armatimonadota bacterium]